MFCFQSRILENLILLVDYQYKEANKYQFFVND